MNDPSKTLYILARYFVAVVVFFYGFAKLNGAQFTILDSELDKPMGQVSGFWLTWYFFGYSKIYGNLIALVQIAGGVLLMFRRTTLLGACLLAGILGNIVLIDVFYGVDLSALMVAIVLVLALLYILAQHGGELLDLFWRRQNSVLPAARVPPAAAFAKGAARLLLLVLPAVFTYWIAHYNNRYPTPIDGAWDVVSVTPSQPSAAAAPSRVFFERNRAYMCVVKYRDGTYERIHFEVDPQRRTVEAWERWLTKGEKLLEGRYDPSGTHLELRGRLPHRSEAITLELVRSTR